MPRQPSEGNGSVFAEKVVAERDELRERLQSQTDWYQQRFNVLRKWVEEDVRPLSIEAAYKYYAIVANGSPSPFESADWRGTLHAAELRAEHWKKKAESLEWQIENLGCSASRKGETTYECNAERPCGLCRTRSALESVKEACDPECSGCGAYFIADKALRSE